MSNSTQVFQPLVDEVKAIDFEWVALEAVADLLCVLMTLYLLMPGIQKLVPWHSKFPEKQRIFLYLSPTWGVQNYPGLFQFLVGLLETLVALGCLACFLPGASAALITCCSLILSIGLCVVFFITLWKDSWIKKGLAMRQCLQAGLALWIKLRQDFETDEFYIFFIRSWAAAVTLGSVFMLYRRCRYGKAPDPLLGK